MNKFCCIGLTIVVAAAALAQDDKEASRYLTDSGRLQRPLKLTLTGDKVETSQTWLIEPSGRWTLTTSGEKSAGTSRSGYFSAAQIDALAKDLRDFHLLELPRDISPRSKAPAKLYALTFGYFTSTYELSAEAKLPDSDPARTDPLALPANRFAAIVRRIQSQLK